MEVLREGEKLIVFDPPLTEAALSVLVACVLLVGLSLFLRHSKPGMPWWIPLVLGLPTSAFAVWLAGSSTKVVLDREGCVIYETRSFLFQTTRTIPLTELSQALIGRGRRTKGLVLQLKSGEEYIVGIFSDRPGIPAAIEAINLRLTELLP